MAAAAGTTESELTDQIRRLEEVARKENEVKAAWTGRKDKIVEELSGPLTVVLETLNRVYFPQSE